MSAVERLVRWFVRPADEPADARRGPAGRAAVLVPRAERPGRGAPSAGPGPLAPVAAWFLRPTAGGSRDEPGVRFAPPVSHVRGSGPPAERVGGAGAAGDFAGAGAAGERPARRAHHRGASLAVLADTATTHALGACLGLGVAGGGVALVCAWRAALPVAGGAPPVPAARRLAGALRARGLAARAAGRLVVVALAGDPADAVAELRRAEAVAGPAARVLALGGARGEDLDDALAERDAVLVHGTDPDVVALAIDRLGERGIPAQAFAPLPGRAVRRLAAAGLVLPGTSPAAAARERSG